MTRSLPWPSTGPTKGVAFAIHLTLSLLVFSVLVIVMLLYWFPGELFFLDGGWQGLKLVAMIDLVLGPALTLILYKPGKPKLLLDMSLIALLQIAALGYGFYTTHQQRTVAIVFAENGFNTVSASDNRTSDQQLLAMNEEPRPLPPASLLHLPLLLTPEPDDFGQFLADILNGYPGPQGRSDQYVPLTQHHAAIQKDALDWPAIVQRGADAAVQNALEKRQLQAEDVEFYTFKARYANGIALFDPSSMTILDYVPDEAPPIAAAAPASDETETGTAQPLD
ncbi:hypothetical protein ACUNV4_13325 [Granulosicoccus sp. 3-233]|uniref:hypothetical protein n=1 Tax=Granulosicoccus sp. 3-233 TaxID=3417969 RepID=UPI003D33A978